MEILDASAKGSASFGREVPLISGTIRAVCVALCVVLSSTAAAADPVRIIQSGAVFTGGDDTGFNLFGPGFSFMASLVLDPIVNCAPCAAGSVFDVSTTLTLNDWAGRATVDGQSYDPVYLRGLFNFDGGSVIVPTMAAGQSGPDFEGLSRELTSFRFTGTLAGFAAPGSTGPPLFATELSGGGAAVVAFSNFPSESGIRVAQLDYDFHDVSATPEPGSLFLFASGAALLAARRRARQPR